MKTNEFLTLLKQHENKELLFEYSPKCLVNTNYHITEVKNVIIDSVDCGANADFWRETIVQLWEDPSEKNKPEFMTTSRALDILKKVEGIKPMVRDAELKIEYSNETFNTAQLFIESVSWNNKKIIFKLSIKKTACKAQDICGIPSKIATTQQSNCTPGSGCC